MLSLHLHNPFQMQALRGGLVRPAPERPGDDVGRTDAALREAGGDAAEFLDRPADKGWGHRGRRRSVFCGAGWFA